MANKIQGGSVKNTTTKVNQSTKKAVANQSTIAALSDSSLASLKKQLQFINQTSNRWKSALSEAETYLNNSIGASFRSNYSVGAKAATNIQKIIDILNACDADLTKLAKSGETFYAKLLAASKK